MNPNRWIELEKSQTKELTEEEILEGWHFCPDWDFMLVGPKMLEQEYCMCDTPSCKPGG